VFGPVTTSAVSPLAVRMIMGIAAVFPSTFLCLAVSNSLRPGGFESCKIKIGTMTARYPEGLLAARNRFNDVPVPSQVEPNQFTNAFSIGSRHEPVPQPPQRRCFAVSGIET
jgi:hypothetical protein